MTKIDSERTSVNDDNQGTNDIEFSVLEILQTVFINRRMVIKFAFVGALLGLFFALFFNPSEYKSRAVILPINSSIETGTSGLLKQFGKLGGISLGGSSSAEAIPPGLYPNILNSTPFLMYLSEQKITAEGVDSSVSVYSYFDEHHSSGLGGFLRSWTIELPDKIIGLFRGDNNSKLTSDLTKKEDVVRLTKKQLSVISTLGDRISVDLDEEIGIIDLNVKMPEAKMTAEIAVLTLNYLTEYSIAYKTDKLISNQEFIQDRYNESESRFYKAQLKLAVFNDRNQNLISARAQSERERLESEYNLTYDLYNGLSQQLEESRIKVQERTPAFKILEPVQVPLNKSSPRKLGIIFFGILGGVLMGLFWAVYGSYVKSFLNKVRIS